MGGSSCKEEKASSQDVKSADTNKANYDDLSAKQLKSMLTERGIETLRCVEKSDLIKCLEVSDQKVGANAKAESSGAKKPKPEITPAQLNALRKACTKLEAPLDRRDASDAWQDARYLVELLLTAADKCPQHLADLYGSVPILTSHLVRLESEIKEIVSRGRKETNFVRCLKGDLKVEQALTTLETHTATHTTASA